MEDSPQEEKLDWDNVDLGGFSPVQVFLSHMLSGGTVAELEGRSPDSVEAMYYVAAQLYNSKQYKEAHPIFHEVVRLNHLEPRYLFSLGACLHKMGLYINAANVYFSSILLKPGELNIEAHYYMAECLISANQSHDQAEECLQHVVDKCPTEGPLSQFRSIAEAKLALLRKKSGGKKGKKASRGKS